MGKLNNILLALDVEQYDKKLLAFALEMCVLYKAKLWIVHVAAYQSRFLGFEDGPDFIRLSTAGTLREEHRFLQKLASEVKEHEVEVEALLIGGEIVKTLIAIAAKISADLIITGVHQHGLLSNVLGGNTALEIIKKSKVPVVSFPCHSFNKSL